MSDLVHPFFGTIDRDGSDVWDAQVTLGGRSVTLDLTIEDGEELSESAVQGLPQTIADLEALDGVARAAMVTDAQTGDEGSSAALYITHHHAELSEELFQRLFGAQSADLSNAEALLSRLVLLRVGFYPEDEERRILLDYSIDPEATNYLLCVSFDANGQLAGVDLES